MFLFACVFVGVTFLFDICVFMDAYGSMFLFDLFFHACACMRWNSNVCMRASALDGSSFRPSHLVGARSAYAWRVCVRVCKRASERASLCERACVRVRVDALCACVSVPVALAVCLCELVHACVHKFHCACARVRVRACVAVCACVRVCF